MLKLFKNLEVDMYCISLNLKKGLELATYYAVVVLIVKRCIDCIIDKEVVGIIEDNRGEKRLV